MPDNNAVLTSRANELVKSVRALSQAKARQEQGVHLIEGEKLVAEAARAGMRFRHVFVEEGVRFPEALPADAIVHTVTRSVLESMSQCPSPQGVLATVETPPLDPPEAYPAGLIAALDRVQDPGNVGTILRAADAMGAVGVLLSKDSADPFAPKTVRAAMGSTYHLPVWRADLLSELQRLLDAGFPCICGHLAGAETLPEVHDRAVLVIGNEGNGVSDAVAERCIRYRLRMRGRAESLNASVAAGILLYEVANRMEEGE